MKCRKSFIIQRLLFLQNLFLWSSYLILWILWLLAYLPQLCNECITLAGGNGQSRWRRWWWEGLGSCPEPQILRPLAGTIGCLELERNKGCSLDLGGPRTKPVRNWVKWGWGSWPHHDLTVTSTSIQWCRWRIDRYNCPRGGCSSPQSWGDGHPGIIPIAEKKNESWSIQATCVNRKERLESWQP